jgi:CheY-like chemotaxis protein
MQIGALIVDDQQDVRLLIRMIIEAANNGLFVSGEAANGREALERIDHYDPTVVVLDAMMPDIDGVATAELIRQRRPGQLMILCSAYLDDELRQKAEAAGIAVCLTKGEFADIPDTVREVASAG